jgi:2-phospho-L-lactate guanylyltransferase
MAGVVVPYRGQRGKSRLSFPDAQRAELALAMLADVLAAASSHGRVVVVTADPDAAAVAPEVVADPGGGQGAAVEAALVSFPTEALVLVVNADLPCATPEDLDALVAATPRGGLALVRARDGTTNALGLSSRELFEPVYGPASARRFRRHAAELGVSCSDACLPNLVDDVDTLEDLEHVEARVGRQTQAALEAFQVAAQ